MKQPVYILGFVLLVFVIYIAAALIMKPESRTLSCTIGVGSFSQTSHYEYTRDQITYVEIVGTEFDAEGLQTQEEYLRTQYIGEDLFDLFDQFITDLESAGHVCNLE